MIKREYVLRRLNERPFKPFKIFDGGGRSYDVRHPEMAWVTPRSILVAISHSGGGLDQLDDYALVSMLRVTSLEPVSSDVSSPPSDESSVPR